MSNTDMIDGTAECLFCSCDCSPPDMLHQVYKLTIKGAEIVPRFGEMVRSTKQQHDCSSLLLA